MQELETELKVSKFEKLKAYLVSVKNEIRIVTWPSVKEVKKYTKLVIYSTLGCGFCVYLVDLVCKGFLDSLRILAKRLFF